MGMRVVVRPDSTRVAEECECRQTQKLSYALNLCGIPKRYEDATLESYDFGFPGAHPSLGEAHFKAKRFADDYPAMMAPGRGLMFVGSSGLGKTHIAVGILKFLVLEKRCDGLFCYYQQLLKDIQDSWNPQTSTTELQVLEPVFNAEVLVLDDLGSVKPTDWVWDTVAMVLNTRYNNKLLTIVTTNFDNLPAATLRSTDAAPRGDVGSGVGGLQNEKARALATGHTLGDRIGDRMYSRLLEMCREVRLQGQDYRERFADEEAGLNGHLSGRR
jgi:DNA replication protein DnaC